MAKNTKQNRSVIISRRIRVEIIIGESQASPREEGLLPPIGRIYSSLH
jgi:hypothetical protein